MRWPNSIVCLAVGEALVRVGGRGYSLPCRDGDEARIAELGAGLDARATALTSALGAMGEGRLLIALAVTLADELAEAEGALGAAAARVEAVAAALEDGA